MKEFKSLIKLLDKDKTKLIFASILIFVAGLSQIFTGYLNGAAVEAITKIHLKEALIFLGIYFAIEIVLDGIIQLIANSTLYKIESALSRKLAYFTYKKSLDLPAVCFEEKSSGEIINRITQDADTLSFVINRILNVISSLVGSAIISVYIFINSWIVGVEIFVILIILAIVIKIYNPKLKNIHKERKIEQDKFTSLVTESLRGIREIKTLGVKKEVLSDSKEIIKRVFKKSTTEIDIQKEFNMIIRFLRAILEVGVFVTCVFLLYFNHINLTFFVAMTYYVYRYMWLIENVNDLTQCYQKLSVSITRVNEILENRLYQDEQFGDAKIVNPKGVIEFKNVTFSYPNEGKMLDNFNLTIVPNKKIAVVGKSGNGKSTLFNLITRIFDVQKGEILIDNINVKDLTEDELRKTVSVIRQEPFIFNKTIKENFLLINKKLSLKEIRKYAKLAKIDDYIMSLPEKYNTVIGEGGVNLSGGQKQRLAIARTLCKESKIILFDEATSALDNESQEYIKNTIDKLVENHTVVIVAHRLSTIIDADCIYIVDKGKIVASGTHQELLETNEIYQNLYHSET